MFLESELPAGKSEALPHDLPQHLCSASSQRLPQRSLPEPQRWQRSLRCETQDAFYGALRWFPSLAACRVVLWPHAFLAMLGLLVGLTNVSCAQAPNSPQSTNGSSSAESSTEVASTRTALPENQAVEIPERLGSRLAGDDWPALLGVDQTGISRETGIRTDWQADPPPILWHLEVGEGYAIGSTSLGRYVHFDRVGDEGRVRALNAETGEKLWEFRYPTDYVDMYGYDGGPRCSPIIDEGRVYVLGPEGMLHCLALSDGRELWAINTSQDYGVVQNFFGVGSTPVVYGDLLYVMIGGSSAENRERAGGHLDEVLGDGTGLVAFDKRTGEERWRTSDELASYSSLKVARILDRDWVLAFTRGGLLAASADDGQTTHFFPWRARILESVNASIPVVDGDRILISETYGPGSAMLQLTERGLETVWADPERSRGKILQTHWNTPVLIDGYVYASSGRHTQNAELRCVRWSDGVVQWSVPDLTRCSLTAIDGHLLCQGEYGDLRLLKIDPQQYREVSRLEVREPMIGLLPARPMLKYPCWAAPVVSHGLLYVRGEGRVVCLELIPKEPR